jgi:hypothetical protein
MFACSAAREPQLREQPAGSIVLALQPLSGLTIASLRYAVTQDGQPNLIREGALPTDGAGGALDMGLDLPPGSGYRLSLSGVSVEAGPFAPCTGTTDPFSISPGVTPLIELKLTCVDNTYGSFGTGIGIANDACPELSFSHVAAFPAVANVSSTVALVTSAQDSRARTVSYAWALADPAIASLQTPAASEATLTCLIAANNIVITVTASNGECSKSAEIGVSCVTAP